MEALNECEAEETSSESEMDSEEMEMEKQCAGKEEDEPKPKPDSYEENHIPISIFLAPTSPNVKELEATAEVNMMMNMEVDLVSTL